MSESKAERLNKLAPPAVPAERKRAVVCEKEYEIELITPMFGGGVTAGEPDESMPIRATSVRGQLRYWWRMTRGRFEADMWRREEEIFGSVAFPSPLEVRVHALDVIKQIDPKTAFDRFGPEAYALFPPIENREQQVVAAGLRFRLAVRWPVPEELKRLRAAQNGERRRSRKPTLPPEIRPISDDVMTAIRAWLAYGGIGARTRRGVGSVHCGQLAGNLPALDARLFLAGQFDTASEAWAAAVHAYRVFRQTPRGAKHPKTLPSGKVVRVPGRSHWPEPDSIRQITGCALRKPGGPSGVPNDENTHDHSVPVVPKHLLPAFPKAILGLPINFHFSDGTGKNPGAPNRNPSDVELRPVEGDRMASPVITRALWRDDAWRAAVIVLRTDAVNDLSARLVGKRAKANGNDVDEPITHLRIAHGALGALQPMRGCANALDALAQFLVDANRPVDKTAPETRCAVFTEVAVS